MVVYVCNPSNGEVELAGQLAYPWYLQASERDPISETVDGT